MTTHRPPVIPEIAKAYQNDPRTKLALAAMAAGSSNAPVAQGGYGIADGIARVLQGAMGGIANRKAEDRYGAEEAQLLAQRQARGVDGMSGAAPSGPAAPPQAAAMAAALGAPPPAQATPPMPGAATPPFMPPTAPQAPAPGGGPMGRRPFGPSVAAPGLSAPVPEALPAAPQVLARPTAPEAVGPTRSKTLDAAYRIMSDANPYESAQGQDMYASGLSDQDKLNESAAERKQRLLDMGYESDTRQYEGSQNAARDDAYQGRRDVQGRNFTREQAYEGRAFTSDQTDKDHAFTARQNDLNRQNAMAVARVREQSSRTGSGGDSTSLTAEERAALSKAVGDKRIDLKGITKFQAKVVAQSLIDNPGLDAVQLHAAAQLAANSPAQQKAMLIQAMPDVLANVRDAGKKVNLSDIKMVGGIQAFAKGQTNNPDWTNYMNKRNDAVQTIASVMRGTGATDKAVQLEVESAPKDMSPRAIEAWYQAQMEQLAPRVNEYEKRGLVPVGTYKSVYGDKAATVPQRKPGETVAQYLARTGG